MKSSPLALIVLVLLSFTGCNKDDSSFPITDGEENMNSGLQLPAATESPVYFTYADENYSLSNNDSQRWVVVHDSRGELLDYRKLEVGQELVFESLDGTVTDEITVTLINRFSFNGDNIRSFLVTYQNVKKGSTWKMGRFRPIEQSGSFTLSATNVPDWNAFIVDSGDSFGGQKSYTFHGQEFEPGTIEANQVPIFSDDEFFLFLTDNEGRTKYMELPPIEDGDVVSVDAANLVDFDRTFELDVPDNTFFNFGVTALFQKNGISRHLSFNSSLYDHLETVPSVTLGYLDGFETYRSSVAYATDDVNYFYAKTGGPLAGYEIPATPAFELISDAPDNFSFTTDAQFVSQRVSFEAKEPTSDNGFNRNTTQWDVNSQPGEFSALPRLPEKLLLETNIYLGGITFDGVSIFTKSNDYHEELKVRFGGEQSGEIIVSENESFSFGPKDGSSAKGRFDAFFQKENSLKPFQGNGLGY